MISTRSRPSYVRTVVVLGGLVLLIALLHAVARLGLRGPSDLSIEGINAWMSDPILVMATVARWVSLVLAYYLLVVTGTSAFFGERLEDSAWGRVTPATVAGLAGLLLGTTAVVLPAATHAHSTSINSAPSEILVLQEVLTPLTLVEEVPEQQPELSTPPEPALQEHSVDSVWTVQSGDSLWSIAEETLAEGLSRDDLTNVEIAEYWQLLIAANLDGLVDPGNPDLILPGQVVVLPPT